MLSYKTLLYKTLTHQTLTHQTLTHQTLLHKTTPLPQHRSQPQNKHTSVFKPSKTGYRRRAYTVYVPRFPYSELFFLTVAVVPFDFLHFCAYRARSFGA